MEWYGYNHKSSSLFVYFDKNIYTSIENVRFSGELRKIVGTVFYTSDIAGRFRVIVQGITNGGVLHGEHFFEVKREGGCDN